MKQCFECLWPKPGAQTGDEEFVVPMVNQIKLHVGMGPDPESLLSYCAERGIVPQAYSPLAHGAVANDTLTSAVARDSGRSAAQVGLRWILQNNHTPALVVKASKADFAREDADLFGWALNATAVRLLDAAVTPRQDGGRPSWGCTK